MNVVTVILAWYLFYHMEFYNVKVKTFLLFKQESGNGEGGPSVYVLLLLVNE